MMYNILIKIQVESKIINNYCQRKRLIKFLITNFKTAMKQKNIYYLTKNMLKRKNI